VYYASIVLTRYMPNSTEDLVEGNCFRPFIYPLDSEQFPTTKITPEKAVVIAMWLIFETYIIVVIILREKLYCTAYAVVSRPRSNK